MTEYVPPQAMSLFDLIGRNWRLESGVTQALFNQDGTALVAKLQDGRLAFLSTKDAESPDVRMRQEVDTGRMTLRPREKPLPPPVYSEGLEINPRVRIVRYGAKGFAFSCRESEKLWRATARGQTLAVENSENGDISAMTELPDAQRIAISRGNTIEIRSVEGGGCPKIFELPHRIDEVTVSLDGSHLACFGDTELSVLEIASGRIQLTVAANCDIRTLEWSPCGDWIVAGCVNSALLICKVTEGAVDRITNFPSIVESVAFSTAANALLASGAFRIVGWSLPDLPFGDHEGDPIKTGKPGLTVVDRLALHQGRDICAASYSNGLIVACRAGQEDELMLHAGCGASTTSMTWSSDGKHLGWGNSQGDLYIATFPDNMFK